ncbi:MAG: phosphoadenylyl-sulfate reductase [Acidimicrobiales bacterium]
MSTLSPGTLAGSPSATGPSATGPSAAGPSADPAEAATLPGSWPSSEPDPSATSGRDGAGRDGVGRDASSNGSSGRRVTSPSGPAAKEWTDTELTVLNTKFETADALEVIGWAVESFSPGLCLTTSMTDAVLIDLAVRVEPAIEVVFIDTGYHFPETLETMEAVRRRYGLNLRIMTAAHQAEDLWQLDPVNCCSAVKAGQLDRALIGKAAWMSGLRRSESPTRSSAPVVGRDLRGLVKVNPLATWSDEDVASYIAERSVPVNPLLALGYLSIGCAPCTRPVADGAHPRSGRWADHDRLECGLHD